MGCEKTLVVACHTPPIVVGGMYLACERCPKNAASKFASGALHVGKAESAKQPRFEVASFKAASFEATSFEAASFEAASFEAASFEAASFEAAAASFEAAPSRLPLNGITIYFPIDCPSPLGVGGLGYVLGRRPEKDQPLLQTRVPVDVSIASRRPNM